MTNDSDVALPKSLTDFCFDLYDSVTTSQLPEEQARLYEVVFKDLSSKYFGAQPWPSPQSIASECNGDPLFLAIYRELTHRHWHQVVASSRPSIRDCIEGWNVYRELFEEVLETAGDSDSSFYLLPGWTFDILQEFVYQFQGYCQIRSAVYASARKHGLLQADGSINTTPSSSSGGNSQQHSMLLDNLNLFETNTDAWDVEIVFSYLHRLVKMGFPSSTTSTSSPTSPDSTSGSANKEIPAVHTYLSLFSCIALSRLECLLSDYSACLQALAPLSVHADYVIPKKEGVETGSSSGSATGTTVAQVLQSAFTARLSLAYHAGVAYLMLRRYKDAINILGDMCAVMQRGFKTGALRKLAQGAGGGAGMLDQFNKQYERMLSLLALLVFSICPSGSTSSAAATAAAGSNSSSSSNNYFLLDDAVLRVLREKHASQLETVSSNYDDWFQSPKFICIDPQATSAYRHQVLLFGKEMQPMGAQRKLRSYLKLYTSLPVEKLAKFHDLQAVADFLPLLLSYKMRMRQIERPAAVGTASTSAADENKKGESKSTASAVGYTDGVYKTALDIHYYVTADDVVHMDEAEKQRRFENYFCAQIIQNEEILQDVLAIDTKV
jgi:translation initiation factor 3 subunit L